MYFNKYADKTDGAIRGFDVKSTKVKIICLFFVAVQEKQHCSLNRLIFQDLRKHGIN